MLKGLAALLAAAVVASIWVEPFKQYWTPVPPVPPAAAVAATRTPDDNRLQAIVSASPPPTP